MGLIDELRSKSESVKATENEVKQEIVDDFKAYINSSRFEDFVESHIGKEELSKRESDVDCEFWKHHDGCSGTHFYAAGMTWRNQEVGEYDYATNSYKGVELYDIHKDVCRTLNSVIIARLTELGFKNIRTEDCTGRLGYMKTKIMFSW